MGIESNLGKFACKGSIPWNKGKKGSQMAWNRGLAGFTNKGSFIKGHRGFMGTKGMKFSLETRTKMSQAKSGKPTWNKDKKCPQFSGSKHWNWKGGIDYRDKNSLFNPDYVKWRSSIFKRDSWKCRIANEDCSGQLETHHILSWKDFPELRYEINNGITLCHAHHPRRRAEEKLLIPDFQRLVGVFKE